MVHLQTLGSEFSPCCTRLYADDECGDYVVKVYRFGHFQLHEGHTTRDRKEAEGYQARAICHEVDHLDGVLFTDHLRGLRKERARRALKKLAADQEVTV